MRIVVDTSVWSLALRRQRKIENSVTTTLEKIIENGENVFLTGIILQEILQGVRDQRQFRKLKEHFDAFPLIEIRREHYVKAAELKNLLGRKGIQAGTIDALIAAAAISHDCHLFTTDRDFQHIAGHSKLRLLKFE